MIPSIAKHKARKMRAKEAKARSLTIDERLQGDAKVARKTVDIVVLGPLHDSTALLERLQRANGESVESARLPPTWDTSLTSASVSGIDDELRHEMRQFKARSFSTDEPGSEAVAELSEIRRETGLAPESGRDETDLLTAS